MEIWPVEIGIAILAKSIGQINGWVWVKVILRSMSEFAIAPWGKGRKFCNWNSFPE